MTSSDEQQRVRVRKRYTLHACVECQRRKRKCTGGDLCRNCRHSGSECVYTALSRSKKQKTAHQSTPNSGSGSWSATDIQPPPDAALPDRPPAQNSNSELASRTHTLEQEYDALKREMAWMREQERDRPTVQSLLPPADTLSVAFSPTAPSPVGSSPNTVFERNIKFVGGTSFFHQIDLLDQSVAREKGEDPMVIIPEEPEAESMDFENLAAPLRRDLEQIVDQTRLENIDRVLQSLDIYFTNLQPHYPCINESHFRAQFAAFLANDTSCMSKNISIQFAALLNYMMAVSRIMYDISTQDDNPLGIKEFYRAEKLLSHATWLEKANIMTIQILLVKSSYCLYMSRLNAAYDTMGTAVRLCFQLGLHNEPSWGAGCSFYDRTYRQRVFWSIYVLNHNVALNAGVPDLIREDDFDVARPRCVDDRMLYPTCPPLPDMHNASLVPYLLEIIKWAQLSSEIWGAMFGVRVTKPASPDFITATDASIVALSRATPPQLLWPPRQNGDTSPAFLVQQSFVLYLRTRALRMLLRRAEMVSLRYEARTAQLCIDIATDVVSAIELSYSSPVPKRTERYAYALHLTGAIVPMICIIVRRDNSEELVGPAIGLFKRAMRVMEAIAVGFAFARRALMQLRRPIRAAMEIVDSRAGPAGDGTGAGLQNTQNTSSAQNVMPTPTSLVQGQLWGGDVPMAAADSAGVDAGVEEWQRPATGELVWDDLDLWNNIIMSTWQS